MPIRPREINDRTTESRLRQVIRQILNQEVKRLLDANATLDVQVAINTSNISTNASGIAQNVVDICTNERRTLMPHLGLVTSSSLGATGGAGVVVTEIGFVGEQVWNQSIDSQPISVTLWDRLSLVASVSAIFDSFQFDAVQFDEATAERTLQVDTTIQSEYTTAAQVFTIDWGVSKTGTLYLLNFGSGTAFSVIAVAD